MKGLLLKDFYMATKYCRVFLYMLVVFIGVSFFTGDSPMFVYFPTLIAGVIPMTLISYDEKDRWDTYSQALPCSKKQAVSAKYLLGLFIMLAVFAVTALVQVFRLVSAGTFSVDAYLLLLVQILAVGLIVPSLLLPFIFKFGTEKGRFAYYIIVGTICTLGVVFANVDLQFPEQTDVRLLGVIILLGSSLLYASSWLLSVRFYKSREF